MPERIVQCHGCFDLLHIGHIRHLAAAKQHGDRLVVTVTADRYVNKGPGRPVFAEALRMEAVAALHCVDEVRLSDAATAAGVIKTIRPHVFAKGPDYSAETLHADERQALEEVGAALVITDTQQWSSTALLQRPSVLAPEVEAYLASMRARYAVADVQRYLDRAQHLRVLVMGDAIRDEYHYVDTLGKSGKDPMLAAQFVMSETFRGGVDAVCQHVLACADVVARVCGSVTTVKRRFVERYPLQKLFEVYDVDATPSAEPVGIQDGGRWSVEDADLVIVSDFGHGFLMPERIARLSTQATYLAVNVQANAGNHGFNTIGKYHRADFLSLSERELRLDARDQQVPIACLAAAASLHRHGARVLVTRGEHGCIATGGAQTSGAPALTSHVVDRTGAGDAVFAVTACCAAVGMPLDLLTFMASIVGTLAVGIVGNARYIERDLLRTTVASYLS